jgi:hypothetical protein
MFDISNIEATQQVSKLEQFLPRPIQITDLRAGLRYASLEGAEELQRIKRRIKPHAL